MFSFSFHLRISFTLTTDFDQSTAKLIYWSLNLIMRSHHLLIDKTHMVQAEVCHLPGMMFVSGDNIKMI